MINEDRALRPFRNLRPLAELLLVMMILKALLRPAAAQEIPRPSLVQQRQKQNVPGDYNFKVGQTQFSFDAGLETSYNDNVYLTNSHLAGDLTITPEVGLNATLPMSGLNAIRLNLTVGYTRYLEHRDLDSAFVTLGPGSALSFDVYFGDFRLDFHDQFSLQEDPVTVGALSNIARLPRFTNTAGINLLWDANKLTWSVGYDHYSFLTLGSASTAPGLNSSDLAELDHTTDQLSTSVSGNFNPITKGGLEATVAISQYPKDSAANFTSSTAGPFFDVQVTRFTHLYLSGGCKGYWSKNGAPGSVGASPQTTRGNGFDGGYYANARFVHRLNHYYSDQLEVGHDDDASAYTGRLKTDFIRYSSVWTINPHIALALGLFYENVQESTGNALLGLVPANFTQAGATIGAEYKITRHVDVSMTYVFTKKNSSASTQSYAQNQVSLSFQYHF